MFKDLTERAECTLLKVTISPHGADIGVVPWADHLVSVPCVRDLKQSLPFTQECYEVGKKVKGKNGG